MEIINIVLGVVLGVVETIEGALSTAVAGAGGWTPLIAVIALIIAIAAAAQAHEAQTMAEGLAEKVEELEHKREEVEEARARAAMMAATIERYGVSEERLREPGSLLFDVLTDPYLKEETKQLAITFEDLERRRAEVSEGRSERIQPEEPAGGPSSGSTPSQDQITVARKFGRRLGRWARAYKGTPD